MQWKIDKEWTLPVVGVTQEHLFLGSKPSEDDPEMPFGLTIFALEANCFLLLAVRLVL